MTTRITAGGLLAACLLASTAAWGAPAWKAPRTPHGQPDLQGVWTNATITPLERPAKFKDRLVLSEAEARELEAEEVGQREKDNVPTAANATVTDLEKACYRGFSGANCGYNSGWIDPGSHVITVRGEKRASILTTPDGKIPTMLPAGEARVAARQAERKRFGEFDHPELRVLGERCILSFGSSAGPPMTPLLYNNNYQIVQTRDEVAILVEMVHDVRTIRIGGKHQPAAMKSWMGDSIGRWEGDTLVIETTNMRNPYRGASEKLKVVERLTRTAADELLYQFEIHDPESWEKPWGGELPMKATQGPIYEYACHEGNHAMEGILAGARQQEQDRAEGGE